MEILVVILVFFIVVVFSQSRTEGDENLAKTNAMTPEQHAAQLFGSLNEHLICPHCQNKGTVRAKSVSRTETSTGKVGGIVKTNMNSSTTNYVTQHHCDVCRTTWDV